MKKKVILFTFLFPLMLFATNHFEKKANHIIYQTEKGFIRLQIFSDEIIRVTISPVKDLNERESLILLAFPDQDTKWSVNETDRYISVTTSKITARLDKDNNSVFFLIFPAV